MKLKSIMIGALALTTLAGCKDSYLETAPESSASPEVIFSTTQNAKLAINGMCRLMQSQYLKTQGCNGEGTYKLYYGDYMGNDFSSSGRTNFASTANHARFEDETNLYVLYPWIYYYRLISNANTAIASIDGAEGSQAERDFIKAQALVFRAYSYFQLTEIYCRRWSDRQGECRGLPLRLEPSTNALPASSLKRVYAQIYADLDQAIELFKESGLDRDPDESYQPSLDVAYAVYARAALTRQDWQKAADNAALARKNYPLMSIDDYCAGFNTNNKEWIWSAYCDALQKLSYYSFHAYTSPNGTGTQNKSYPPGVSKDLIDLIPASDARRQLVLVPDDDWTIGTGKTDAFTSTGLANSKDSNKMLTKRAQSQFGDKLGKSTKVFAYMSVKYQALDGVGIGELNLFRASEMLLTEAEALCMIGGHDAEVQKLLVALNVPTKRDPEYSCTKTGNDLLEEVRLYRRWDLWGEGFSFFDYKRWGLPIVRRAFASKGANNAGSFHSQIAGTWQPDEINNWCMFYPEEETNYNSLVTPGEGANWTPDPSVE